GYDVLALVVRRGVLAFTVAIWSVIRAPAELGEPHLLLPITVLLHDGALVLDAAEVEGVVAVVVVYVAVGVLWELRIHVGVVGPLGVGRVVEAVGVARHRVEVGAHLAIVVLVHLLKVARVGERALRAWRTLA